MSVLVAASTVFATVADMLSRIRRLRNGAFTLLELAATIIVLGILAILIASNAGGALEGGRLEPPKRTLVETMAAQHSRYDLSGEWLTPATADLEEISLVAAATASTDPRTVSVSFDVVGGYQRVSAATSDGYGNCVFWRSFESGAPNPDVRYVFEENDCSGNFARTASGGSSW